MRRRDASPALVWEWLVVEALVREAGERDGERGVPGTLVTRRALEQHGYLDARSYLKTPRIFGFHGVYKRLAIHLGLVDVHLGPGPNAEELLDAWARDLGHAGISDVRLMLARWSAAVRRSLAEKPPRTRPNWSNDGWKELAHALAPSMCKSREKRFLRNLLHATDQRRLGALPAIWQLQTEFDEGAFQEELLHDRLQQHEPSYRPLLGAIRSYEIFARNLQDAFDVMRTQAARRDVQGLAVREMAGCTEFEQSVCDLHKRFEAAHEALCNVTVPNVPLQDLFKNRFQAFREPKDAGQCAMDLCSHHEAVQRGKSPEGKRPWFDRLGQDRIFVRHAYRESSGEIQPGRYVHDYRSKPIRRFFMDLS
jgi:hypothetical protein